MDKEKVIKKIKQGAPATSAIVVAACIGVSLSGYQAPVSYTHLTLPTKA